MLTAISYNDEEPSTKPVAAPEPDQYSVLQPAAESGNVDYAEEVGQQQDQNGEDGAQIKYEEDAEEEDEDDIDFNLGNGPSAAVTHHDEKPVLSTPPAPAPPARGPNAKEDG